MARLLWTVRQHVGPRPRTGHTLAFDSQRQRVTLFGGQASPSQALGDTWEWDGENWTQMDDIGPPARFSAGMAYDSARRRSVLFGGDDGTNRLGDTWEWSGEDWTQVADDGPAARAGHGLVFDASRNRALLFGGESAASLLNDTWEWDGEEWVQVEDTGPAPRRGHAMTFDAGRGRVVLFGGFSGSDAFADTWEWDGSAWTQTSDFGPPAAIAATIVHNSRGALLFGGVSALTGTPELFGRTWEWNGRHWTARQDMGPGPRWGHAMVFDLARARGVLFGGTTSLPSASPLVVLGDTWEQFERGAAVVPPSPPPPPVDVDIISLALVPAQPIEGQPFDIEVTLSAIPATGTTVTFSLTDQTGADLFGGAAMEVGSSTSVSVPSVVLAAGAYVASASLGSVQSTSFQIAPLAATSVQSLVASPAAVTAGVSVTLTATLTTPAPASGVFVPLQLTIDGTTVLLWIQPPLQVAGGQSTGNVVIDTQAFPPASLVWTASLGGSSESAAVR